ncbi:beta-ketoacyl-ACP synthase III [uncultured Clostridium sp.]|uniref:beta-ketoacyl-ACP synthase III n=1 Tax=uncultured Clostridium sp. TaxID=59620 RepID=UPI0025E587AF|nr:beta-ketoacyl-ACP synthase III [uncultured Clostridium sp.]MDU4882301.1 beta-ketoacyl-ACP synthase III [Clostridium celatum]MDU7075571.1 beta-ketoacyl-ACP synthase III [Clostridium celatum]
MSLVKIVGIGHYCPENAVSNNQLSNLVDTSHEWIVKRTGICERKISKGESTVDLAVKASINAMKMAKCSPEDIDLIVVATTSPDRIMPSTACSVQSILGCDNAAAFDISAACSGFLYASIIANSLIKNGEGSKALVIGSEVLSRIIDWNDRNTCVLFGDGAGAAILEVSSDNSGIISTYFGSDGKTGTKALTANQFPIKTPFADTSLKRDEYIQMDGREVFKFAISIIPKVVKKLLENSGEDISNIKYIIPHQANIRIIDDAAKKLNISKDKFYVNLESYGNTSAASIPIAFSEAVNKGLLNKGDKIILVAFGGGLTWSGILLGW